MQYNREPQYGRLLSILGLASLVAGLIVMLLLPEIKLAAWGIMGLGIILLVYALVSDFRQVSGALTGRRGRLGAGTTIMASIFLGIILVVNGISVTSYHRFDTTQLSQFTLTDQTKAVLKNLKDPIKVICFFVPSKDQYGITVYAADLLQQYKAEKPDLITIETVDPDQHPDIARQYGISQYQTVVFESGKRRVLVQPSQIIQFDSQGNPQSVEAEHAFTSAILQVTGVAQKHVYFVTGDGEADINGSYSDAVAGLRDDLYLVDSINLITTPKIPSDCAALIIAAPQTPLSDGEINVISNYLASGGQALILTDPMSSSSDNASSFNGLEKIVTQWGVDLKNGTIIDPSSDVAPKEDVPLVTWDRNFFQSMGLQLNTYFPDAAAVIPQDNTPFQMQPLVWTSTSSYLVPNYDPIKDPSPAYDASQDTKGPLSIGVLIAAPANSSNPNAKLMRLVVIGDSDFANNTNYSQVNNGDLFLNCVNWLSEETQLITIHRIAMPFRQLVLNPGQTNFLDYSSLVIPPVLVILIGVVVYWYRR